MATGTQTATDQPQTVPIAAATDGPPEHHGLASKWPIAMDLAGSSQPCRLEGEFADLPVLGTIPDAIDGTFYRVMCDPFVPPHPQNVPIDGDGSISAFRLRGGRVDARIRYIETERYRLERRAGRALFGLYRNPYTHHPCVRAAVDSTANTNLVYWAGQLLALKEVALPYAVDPDTLATRGWVVLVLWPFEADVERMKQGGQHWAWSYERPATFVVVPRRKGGRLPEGWKDGEYRTYHWENAMLIHTGAAWESDDGARLWFESSRVMDNAFPFFPPADGRMPAPDAQADFVRWELDLTAPSGTRVADPRVVLDMPAEFPRIDERFLTRQCDALFACVFLPNRSDGGKNIFHGLNALAMHSHSSGQTRFFYAGDDSLVQEPVFIPRAADAPEGDGWVMAMVERRGANRNDLVVLDTREFEKPVAIVQLPLHVKAQIHGNWVDASELGEWKSLVTQLPDVEISGKGALEPMI
ncbi:putative isoeugenol monooxygenase protein [Neofusicoccum parvum UCRNP2]|uniref:Putative isoeugenol monooxygenase protein n=1 Tax=Botryosphaeria parva (strain UCR-NP2) TaxID=1287680 RepID=R1EH94_BOTPV|nr:putative isoeugenol monooxygenase protein [Neofusicoccum parvum UCRNP2]